MALTRNSVLWYWSARYGMVPTVGASDVSFFRTSVGTHERTDGFLNGSWPVAKPRYEYVTVDGKRVPGLVLEPGIDNLAGPSEDFSHANWIKSTNTAWTLSPNAWVAPDGTQTADAMIPVSGWNDRLWMRRDFGAQVDNFDMLGSFFVRPKGSTISKVRIGLHPESGAYRHFDFDLASGVWDAWETGDYAGMIRYPDDWWRIWCYANTGTDANNYAPSMFIEPVDSWGSWGVTGDGSDGLLVWGSQFTEAKYPSSYVRATGSTATRDFEGMHWTGVPKMQPMAFFLRFPWKRSGNPGGSNFQVWLHVGGTTGGIGMQVWEEDGEFRVDFNDYNNGGIPTSSAAIAGVTPADGDMIELVPMITDTNKAKLLLRVAGGGVVSSAEGAAFALPSSWATSEYTYLGRRPGGEYSRLTALDYKAVEFAPLGGLTDTEVMDELANLEMDPFGRILG